MNLPRATLSRSFELLSSVVIRASSLLPHLPIFQKLDRNLLQKTRRPLKHVAIASGQPHVRIGEIKLVARARDRHIEQSAFFFQRVTSVERAAAWEHPVGQPDDEHGIKLETLRLVHRR